MRRSLAAWALLMMAAGCNPPPACEGTEAIVVNETGTCSGAPTQFRLKRSGCRVSVETLASTTGLPDRGQVDTSESPLRQGGFELFGGTPFRVCHADRVDYFLRVSCIDGSGAPVCEAKLTEPAD